MSPPPFATMSDVGGQGGADTAAAEAAPSEAGSNKSISRKGSAVTPAVDQKQLSADNDGDLSAGEQGRRGSTSSVQAPSSGGNDSMGSLHGEGAVDEAGSAAGGSRKVSVAVAVESEEEGFRDVVAWVKEHLVLPEFVPEKHWRQEHEEVSYSKQSTRSMYRLEPCIPQYARASL